MQNVQAVLIRNNIMYVTWHSTELFIGLPEKDLMTPSIISPISTIPIVDKKKVNCGRITLYIRIDDKNQILVNLMLPKLLKCTLLLILQVSQTPLKLWNIIPLKYIASDIVWCFV